MGGPIAGGVIGGIAALGVIGYTIYLLRRQKKMTRSRGNVDLISAGHIHNSADMGRSTYAQPFYSGGVFGQAYNPGSRHTGTFSMSIEPLMSHSIPQETRPFAFVPGKATPPGYPKTSIPIL
jgi:hypothetical protein